MGKKHSKPKPQKPKPVNLDENCPTGYEWCADPSNDEEGVCEWEGKVSYGNKATKKWHYKESKYAIQCNDKTFGDPAPGKKKACCGQKKKIKDWTKHKGKLLTIEKYDGRCPSGYKFCCKEQGVCYFTGGVAYGANDNFYFRTSTGNIDCNSRTFGNPAKGQTKYCCSKEEDSRNRHVAQAQMDEFGDIYEGLEYEEYEGYDNFDAFEGDENENGIGMDYDYSQGVDGGFMDDVDTEYGGPISMLGEGDFVRTEFALMTMVIVTMCCIIGCVVGVITGFVGYGMMEKKRKSIEAMQEKQEKESQHG